MRGAFVRLPDNGAGITVDASAKALRYVVRYVGVDRYTEMLEDGEYVSVQVQEAKDTFSQRMHVRGELSGTDRMGPSETVKLSDVAPDRHFRARTGENLSNLFDLLDLLRRIDEESFYYHVNAEKNDFSPWIADCVGDTSLAEEVRDVYDKERMADIVGRRVREHLMAISFRKMMSLMKKESQEDGETDTDDGRDISRRGISEFNSGRGYVQKTLDMLSSSSPKRSSSEDSGAGEGSSSEDATSSMHGGEKGTEQSNRRGVIHHEPEDAWEDKAAGGMGGRDAVDDDDASVHPGSREKYSMKRSGDGEDFVSGNAHIPIGTDHQISDSHEGERLLTGDESMEGEMPGSSPQSPEDTPDADARGEGVMHRGSMEHSHESMAASAEGTGESEGDSAGQDADTGESSSSQGGYFGSLARGPAPSIREESSEATPRSDEVSGSEDAGSSQDAYTSRRPGEERSHEGSPDESDSVEGENASQDAEGAPESSSEEHDDAANGYPSPTEYSKDSASRIQNEEAGANTEAPDSAGEQESAKGDAASQSAQDDASSAPEEDSDVSRPVGEKSETHEAGEESESDTVDESADESFAPTQEDTSPESQESDESFAPSETSSEDSSSQPSPDEGAAETKGSDGASTQSDTSAESSPSKPQPDGGATEAKEGDESSASEGEEASDDTPASDEQGESGEQEGQPDSGEETEEQEENEASSSEGESGGLWGGEPYMDFSTDTLALPDPPPGYAYRVGELMAGAVAGIVVGLAIALMFFM